MNREQQEQLSSLLDDALDPVALEETLDALNESVELRELWGRYHLLRDVLRGEPVDREVHSIADQVQKRLAAEEIVRPSWPRPRIIAHEVAQTRGWALAASVAILAISGSALFQGDAIPPLQMMQPESQPQVLYLDTAGSHWGLRRPEVESKLNNFLLHHQAHTPMAGLKGVVPYAAFVHDDVRR
jgi:sigma-E factor negative regulatory protein RseA